jgi:hypothetical protein
MDTATHTPTTLPPRRARRRSYRGDARFAKSAITNGRETLPDVDNRSALARRYRDIITAIVTDLGGDVPQTKMQVIRRFAFCCVAAERLEAAAANGEQVDALEHMQLSSTIGRLAARIGTARVAKTVQSFGDLLIEQQREASSRG